MEAFRGGRSWWRADWSSAMIQVKIRRAGARHQPMVASLLSAVALIVLQAAATPTPIKLAIFDFELDDASAGVSSTAAADTMQLKGVTNDVRQLFEQAGHYVPIDGSTADADAARAHILRDCNDCAAAIGPSIGRGPVVCWRREAGQPHGICSEISNPRCSNRHGYFVGR